MLVEKPYNREQARVYAERWAYSRNPLFLDFGDLGGNCTNFVSQCLYAGSCRMNFTPTFGWYYLSPEERTASWTGVDYLYRFLTENTGVGPYAAEVGETELTVGDVIQLSREESGYYHSVLVVGNDAGDYLVAAHTNDAYERPLSTYNYDEARFLHILGVRLSIPDTEGCFADFLEGVRLFPEGM